VKLFVSPYDVPDAVRGYFDLAANRFVIEFKYIGNEDWKLQPVDQHLAVRVGVNSGRLYGILLDPAVIRVGHVAVPVAAEQEIRRTLDQLAERPKDSRRRENYLLARDIVSTEKQELFKPLLAFAG
jgi:hypothetical protein